ncbi:scaffold protein NifU [Pelomyxa schiedti]|nr:scaffold protein NifU [Pelomyxa schiedti]
MGKERLVGGGLWEQYSQKVSSRMNNPQHRGEITEAEATALGGTLVVADFGAEACGDMVRLYWVVDPATNIVKLARFKSFGCGTAIASSDIMCELCIGKNVDDTLGITNLVVEQALRDTPDKPAVPPQKMHCSVMAHDVLKKAVAAYKGVDSESLEDREIVCACARVTLGTIKEVIRLNKLTTVEQITQYTKAGGFCKSCIRPGGHEAKKYYLADILRDTLAEMELEQVKASLSSPATAKATTTAVTSTTPASTTASPSPSPSPATTSTSTTPPPTIPGFGSMTLIRKLNTIDGVLTKVVRPRLFADGGDCEVLDVKEQADGTFNVYIQYSGACENCASARTMTLAMIEGALRCEIDDRIRAIPVFPEPTEDE